ncbi:alpha/beta fold hydrolase [Pseudooceanicola marinus]|uniref:alpha/beta fold hydrolase n=1 Tax=Pseudooceanicola marinus TaxID=396013 RepID=UPI001CD25A7D|nr:alpha/beta hydrolase [Pseudooceanicola marinus]MCA1335079.1 alpha/beta hydrolase [Pseudooceanicola marinus]
MSDALDGIGLRTWGETGRKLLMIHCSLAHSGAWGGVAKAMDGLAQMRAFDLPGHGRSVDWDPAQSFQEQARDMAVRVIEDWGGGPVDLVGHSFGATVALRLAVDRPDLVRSLALYEPVFFTAAFRAFPGMEAQHDRDLADFDTAFAAGDRDGAARAFMRVWGDGRPWTSLPEAQRAGFVSRIHLIDAIRDTNYGDPAGMLSEGKLAALDLPVLLMDGADSPVFAPRINEALLAEIPGARRQVVAGAAHMGVLTAPEAVASLLKDFLDLEVAAPPALPAGV